MKERISIYMELALRFKQIVERFAKIHSTRLEALEKWLQTLTQDTNPQTEELIAVDDFLHEMVLKDGLDKVALIRTYTEDKKKLESRVYHMKHLIVDTNSSLTVQEGLLNDMKADEDAGHAAVGEVSGNVPFWYVFAWLLLVFLAALTAVAFLMKFKPEMFGLGERTTVKAIMGGGCDGEANPNAGVQ